MNRLAKILMMASVTVVFTACGETEKPSSNANTGNTNAAKPAAAAPSKEALLALDKQAYEAWMKKDGKFFEGFLADNFVILAANGRRNKAGEIKEITESKCDINSISFSDDQMTSLGADVVLMTFKAAIDGTCDGQKVPAAEWAATIFVRNGDKWMAAFHAGTPIPDPKAAATNPTPSAKKDTADAQPAETDPATEALMAVERIGWDAWKNKDAKALDDWAGKDMVSILSDGGRVDRATALKTWSEHKCEVKSYSLTDGASIAYGSGVSLLTFKASVDGKCDGKAIPTEWDATVYRKEGDAWKPILTMSVPGM